MNQQTDLEQFALATDLDLDPGIRQAVLVLRSAGVETFESCEGRAGHAFSDPTIKFQGGAWAGYRAFAVAMEYGLPPLSSNPEKLLKGSNFRGPLVAPWPTFLAQ